MVLSRDLVVVVTGAGDGLGRAHALELARQGARVVVNDLGVSVDGRVFGPPQADAVVAEIQALGGQAVANHDDVADWRGAHRLVATAVDAYGRVDGVVTNAGIIRYRPLPDMDQDDWDAIATNHLGGTFCPVRAAVAHWSERRQSGEDVTGSVVCTTSQSGLYGMPGFSSYAAAKAGVAAFVIVAARELAELGVRVNAIAPRAHTRMLDALGVPRPPPPEGGFDERAPENVSPMVAWLTSPEAAAVTGRVFEVAGGEVAVCEGWRRGPSTMVDRRWQVEELGGVVAGLLAEAEEPAPVPLSGNAQGVFARVQQDRR